MASQGPSGQALAAWDRMRRDANRLLLTLGAAVAMGVVTGLIGAGIAEPLVVALAIVGLNLPTWLGAEPKYPVPGLLAALDATVGSLAMPLMGMAIFLAFLARLPPDMVARLTLQWFPLLLCIVLAWGFYRWRDGVLAIRTVRGTHPALAPGERLRRHLLGHVAGLAAALLAAGALNGLAPAFMSAYLVAKLSIDLALPQPPLETASLGGLFARMALFGPVFWGVPWGVALTLFALHIDPPLDLAALPQLLAGSVAYLAIALLIVCSALAAAAYGAGTLR